MEKTLGNTDVNGAHKNVPDIQVFGNGDMFQLLCKASSQAEGWMKSTKAMEIPKVGCVVQVTTQQRNPDGSYAVAEALTFVPGVEVEVDVNPDTGEVRGRELLPIAEADSERPAVSGLNSGYWHRRAEIMEMYTRQIINADEARAMLGISKPDPERTRD